MLSVFYGKLLTLGIDFKLLPQPAETKILSWKENKRNSQLKCAVNYQSWHDLNLMTLEMDMKFIKDVNFKETLAQITE